MSLSVPARILSVPARSLAVAARGRARLCAWATWGLLLLLLTGSAGCARWFHARPTAPVSQQPPLQVRKPGDADTTRFVGPVWIPEAPASADSSARAGAAETRRRPRTAAPSGDEATDPATAGAQAKAVNAQDTSSQQPPVVTAPVSVEVSDGERTRLIQALQHDIESAQNAVDRLDRDTLSSEKLSLLQSIEDLLRAARRARDQEQIQQAAALAHKARLLAGELRAR